MANAVGPNGYDGSGGGGGGGSSGRPPRLPRWTRQEILVLIQGKKVVEGRGRGVGAGRAEGGRQQLEPKWAAVASYCRRHGVDRGPVQCRKRWSNLAGDYKKIKEWERAKGGDKGESFWAMRNDLRRERRLPGFFDREVYDILDGVVAVAAAVGEDKEEEIEEEEEEEAVGEKKRRRRKKKEEVHQQQQQQKQQQQQQQQQQQEVEEEEEEEEEEVGVEEAVFDSGRTAAEDGLFSDSEEEAVAVAVAVTVTSATARGGKEAEQEEERSALPPTTATATAASAAAPVVVMPISEKKYEQPHQEISEPGTSKDKQPADDTEKGSPSREGGQKRKRVSEHEETNIESQLIDVLERNSRMLNAQLEAQNLNSQLDRDQRKDQTNSLLVILDKLTDALGKIADKL